MNAPGAHVYDVTESEFQQNVIEASHQRAVVVDFWSPMCGPCRVLGPILERIVENAGGKLALAKIKVDENPGLAMSFGVQGVPAVKVFRNGKVVTEFVGALPESDVQRILDAVVPSEADELVEKASAHAKAGQAQEAEALYRQALAKKPDHRPATLGLAYLAVERGGLDEARRLAESIDPGTPEKELADALVAQLDFLGECRALGDKAPFAARVAADPDDLEARYALAHCLAAEGAYAQALEELLEIIRRDKAFKDGAAKDAMVRIFGIVGKRSDLADAYRSKLASALY
jgi:putative thioredoxin